jgi:aspartyl-tRNA(Asn)/glutamyl-tRNA(Gln) amidotransferase subunit C
LARLDFKGEELDSIKGDMEKIIGFMDKLSEIDTENVEPLIFMNEKVNVLREDVSNQTLSKEDALSNAPKSDSDYFRIPKVLDK